MHQGVVGTGSGVPDLFSSQPLWPWLPTGAGKRVHCPLACLRRMGFLLLRDSTTESLLLLLCAPNLGTAPSSLNQDRAGREGGKGHQVGMPGAMDIPQVPGGSEGTPKSREQQRRPEPCALVDTGRASHFPGVFLPPHLAWQGQSC